VEELLVKARLGGQELAVLPDSACEFDLLLNEAHLDALRARHAQIQELRGGATMKSQSGHTVGVRRVVAELDIRPVTGAVRERVVVHVQPGGAVSDPPLLGESFLQRHRLRAKDWFV
jgi:hypothetical protein